MFQSTHPRRVRLAESSFGIRTACFNPRTHVGCDNKWRKAHKLFCSFNPRTHVGCDAVNLGQVHNIMKFQSTHPRRVRQNQIIQNSRDSVFQSTHPRRVRLGKCAMRKILTLFQSTHPRRVRQAAVFSFAIIDSFNPRTHVGCDSNEWLQISFIAVSIHAPT